MYKYKLITDKRRQDIGTVQLYQEKSLEINIQSVTDLKYNTMRTWFSLLMYDFLENTKGLRNVELQKHHT